MHLYTFVCVYYYMSYSYACPSVFLQLNYLCLSICLYVHCESFVAHPAPHSAATLTTGLSLLFISVSFYIFLYFLLTPTGQSR